MTPTNTTRKRLIKTLEDLRKATRRLQLDYELVAYTPDGDGPERPLNRAYNAILDADSDIHRYLDTYLA
tara:strand:- start:171 stop:377 length:207 start_codon:yes stop_codon:yes gene_type:complete